MRFAPNWLPQAPFEHHHVAAAGAERIAAFDRGHDDFGRAEQQRVDGIKIALELLEYLGERLAEVARSDARQLVSERLGPLCRPPDEELDKAAIDDCVVGAAHCGEEI